MRVLVVGWFSIREDEPRVGDVLSAESVCSALRMAGYPYDLVLGPGARAGGPALNRVDPAGYTHLVFVCGPVAGHPVRELHERFASCRRIAVGVTVPDPAGRAAAGFHAVLPRDGAGIRPHRDLAAAAVTAGVPVAGVVLGSRPGRDRHAATGSGDHRRAFAVVGDWLARRDCARLPLDIRLGTADWRRCGSTAQVESLVRRLDIVVTTLPDGLALGLKNGVPVLAMEPVAGDSAVTGQAAAWHWPAVLPPDSLTPETLERWWNWCLSAVGRADAESCRAFADLDAERLSRHLPMLLEATAGTA